MSFKNLSMSVSYVSYRCRSGLLRIADVMYREANDIVNDSTAAVSRTKDFFWVLFEKAESPAAKTAGATQFLFFVREKNKQIKQIKNHGPISPATAP
jgi:hypothetical protein